jgi:nanoRNase/pAp phosphatase (c-di-AMP/oligoRNAs hydrolase)
MGKVRFRLNRGRISAVNARQGLGGHAGACSARIRRVSRETPMDLLSLKHRFGCCN